MAARFFVFYYILQNEMLSEKFIVCMIRNIKLRKDTHSTHRSRSTNDITFFLVVFIGETDEKILVKNCAPPICKQLKSVMLNIWMFRNS